MVLVSPVLDLLSCDIVTLLEEDKEGCDGSDNITVQLQLLST